MKRIIPICIAITVAFSACQTKQAETIVPCDSTKSYKLTWNEEFNYTGLPDTSIWVYEVGYIRNDEKQYYTKNRTENVRVEDGNLVIESRKEPFEGFAYTSGSINTLGKVEFPVNSRMEIRAKLPSGKGIWPAIWSMGTDIETADWPKCGEIDIMEFVGHTPGIIWGTFHWLDTDSALHRYMGDSIAISGIHNDYHIYGVERTAEQLSFFVDNHYYYTFDMQNTVEKDLFKKPFYLLINTAIGGGWGGEIDTTIFPQKFYVDWVRVFEIPGKK
jgi:beta-glucanase (GH16 family)